MLENVPDNEGGVHVDAMAERVEIETLSENPIPADAMAVNPEPEPSADPNTLALVPLPKHQEWSFKCVS